MLNSKPKEDKDDFAFTGCFTNEGNASTTCACKDWDLCNDVECSEEGFAALGPFVKTERGDQCYVKRPAAGATCLSSSVKAVMVMAAAIRALIDGVRCH